MRYIMIKTLMISVIRCEREKCQLPDCHCGGDEIPSNLTRSRTPQLVMLTFDDSLNDLNRKLYESIFQVTRDLFMFILKRHHLMFVYFSLQSGGILTAVQSLPLSMLVMSGLTTATCRMFTGEGSWDTKDIMMGTKVAVTRY